MVLQRRKEKEKEKAAEEGECNKPSPSFALTLCSLYQSVCIVCVWESIINFFVVVVVVLVT